MKSNYKRIGDYIRLVDERNHDLEVEELLGLSIDKVFIPSVANTVGTNMANYKVIKKGQFACSLMQVRRDKKIPVALLRDHDRAIISQAYPVFEVIDTEVLEPEYLMMWMSRSEFDRHACFLAVGGVRGSMEWEDFCDMPMPIPHIDKQCEIVREYNTIVDRIKLNEHLNQKLEETAQALYKQWFVDFEFPISRKYAESIGKPELEGRPYKSSGGDFVYCSEFGEHIPIGWKTSGLGGLIGYKKGKAFKSEFYSLEGTPIVKVSNFDNRSISLDGCSYIPESMKEEYSAYELETGDVLVSTVGSWPDNPNSVVGQVVRVPATANGTLLNQNVVRLRANNHKEQAHIYLELTTSRFSAYLISGAQGSANQASVTLDHMFGFKILVADRFTEERFCQSLDTLYTYKANRELESNSLVAMKGLALVSIVAKGQ